MRNNDNEVTLTGSRISVATVTQCRSITSKVIGLQHSCRRYNHFPTSPCYSSLLYTQRFVKMGALFLSNRLIPGFVVDA